MQPFDWFDKLTTGKLTPFSPGLKTVNPLV
jgi:hypothetical protein